MIQFKVIVVVDRCLGEHFEELFTVIDPTFDFRLLLVHAPKGANPVNDFGHVQTIDVFLGSNWPLWFSICTAEDENNSNNKSRMVVNIGIPSEKY